MKSIGVRLAFWYSVAAMATMLVLFVACRYFLEEYLIDGLDLMLKDEFRQIESHLGPDYATLTREQIQSRLRGTAAYGSVLFYFDVHSKTRGELFSSANLRGRRVPDLPGLRFYNTSLPGDPYEVRAAEFILGPLDVMIATSKEQVKHTIDAYERIFVWLGVFMLAASAGVGLVLSRIALRPVRLIQETANRIGSDNLTERIPVPDVHDEISNLARLLNRMFDRLESSFKQIRRFTAEASHELKTPLSLVRLQAEKLLVEGGLTPGQEEAVQMQLEEIARMNQIIEELLFLSRAEARAITLSSRRADPRRFLHGFGQDARVLAEHRGMRFIERISGVGVAEFDPKWLRQVLLNLVANALDASPPGGAIRLSSDYTDGWWRVAVEDEGPGVPADQRERIFERFVRLEQPGGRPSEKGSGLGLAISRSIIDLHRGRIRAEAGAGGRGLRVVFELPAAEASAEPGVQEDRPKHGRQAADPGRDLGEGHELHAVARGENRDVAGPPLGAAARVHDGEVDREHPDPARDDVAGAHHRDHGGGNGEQIGHG